MAARFHLTVGAASLAAWLVGAASVAGQVKRPWIDPPPELGAGGPAKPVEKPQPAPASPTASPEQVGKSTASSEKPANPVPAPAPAHAAAPGDTPPVKPAVASRGASESTTPRRHAAEAVRARPPAVAKARASTHTARAGAPMRPPKSRVVVRQASRGELRPGRPLEIMNLTTIELQDGRRIKVLTRPDPQTIESLLGP